MLASIGWACVVIGLIVSVIGAFGCLKFPDLYTKLHALSVSDSFGIPIALAGLILVNGFNFASLKIFLIIVIVLFVNPLSTHALIRAGIMNGLHPIGKIKTALSIKETTKEQ